MGRKAVDLTGQKFGRLTVIDRSNEKVKGGVLWNVICDCGTRKTANSTDLLKGLKSCGCLARERSGGPDLTGQTFGRLTVIDSAGKIDGKYRWNVICDCGTEKTAPTSQLTTGRTKSCGCLRAEKLAERYKRNYESVPDLTGQKFERLTVLERAQSANKRARWTVQCECGTVKDVDHQWLMIGRTRSCGCLKRELASVHARNGFPAGPMDYMKAHNTVYRARGTAKNYECLCGAQATEWAYDHKDKSEVSEVHRGIPVTYSLDPSHYNPMCTSCHRALDAQHRRAA